MDKFTVTEIQYLSPGDRFYFLKDKKRTVLEVIMHENKLFKYGMLSTWVVDICYLDHRFRDNFKKHVKSGRKVVFLRHNNKQDAY